MGFWANLATAAIPSVVNGISQLFTNKSNQRNYEAAQERANAFARSERLQTQAYNSLENQFGQMARVGMNPNLLTGQSFVASSPMSNQPVSPPLNTAPTMPSETLSQAAFNSASAENQRESAVTTKELRSGLIRQQNAEYDFTVANTANTRASLPAIQKQTDLIDTTINDMVQRIIESDARTQNIREDTARMRELRGTWRRDADAKFNNIVSSTAVNGAQRQMLLANKQQILALAEQLRFQNDINNATRNSQILFKLGERTEQKVRIQNAITSGNMLRFQFGQMKTYSEFERVLGDVSSTLNVVNQLIELSPYERAKKDLKDLLPFSNSSPSTEPLQTPYGSGGFSSSWSQ